MHNKHAFIRLYRTAVDEQKYEEICSRLLNAKRHVIDTKDWFVTLKATKPRVVRASCVDWQVALDLVLCLFLGVSCVMKTQVFAVNEAK